jgi:hypothetical protein
VTTVVEKVLGRTRLTKLRRIWRRAHKTADDDATSMVELGRRWCKALGIAPDRRAPDRGARAPGPPSPLAEAVKATVNAVAAAKNDQAGPDDGPPGSQNENWLGRKDLNPRTPDPEVPPALPCGYSEPLASSERLAV